MKKLIFIIGISLWISGGAEGQERDQYLMDLFDYEQEMQFIIKSSTDALGGSAANRTIGSYQADGIVMKRSGTVGTFNWHVLKENWARADYIFEGEHKIFSIHGRRGWLSYQDSSRSDGKVSRLKKKDLAIEEYLNLYENNLFDHRIRGLEVYYEGEITSAMTDAYIIRLAGFSYGEEVYYINKETFRPFIKQVYLNKGRGDAVITYSIDEYIEVGSVWLPKRLSIEGEGNLYILEFQNYDLLAEPEEELFIN